MTSAPVMILVSVLSLVPASAQQSTASKPVVMVGVDVSNNRVATLGIPSGDRATVSTINSPAVAIYPTVADRERLQIVVAELGTDQATGLETIRELKRGVLALGESLMWDYASKSWTVTWLELRTPPSAGRDSGEPCVTCCVYCQDVMVCGCNVLTACGRCCCSEVCSCTINGSPLLGTGILTRALACGGPAMLR
jgi:hypothetical protein